jgi:hypothetical protein
MTFQAIPSGAQAPNTACAGSDFLQDFISEIEYAARRGVSVRTCQRDRQLRQAPPYVRFGRRIYYRIEAVREWLVKNERAADRTTVPPARRRRG